MNQIVTSKRVAKTNSSELSEASALPTLMDHLRELQGRLFSTVFVFVLVAGAAYPFFDKIAAFLLAPLKEGQELVYLTPGGAFSFIIKVCVYVGIIGTLPVIIFNLYRFIMPAVRKTKIRTVLKYTIASLFLAVGGTMFAYYVSLPASLYFLTGFSLNHIDPMLTIDSYFSFVMTYMLAGALLFQLPLVMLIINSVTPLTPKKLMSFQRHMLVGSFVIAAIISPTPDALNQILLASPLVVMYQLGIFMIWRVNAAAKKRAMPVVSRRERKAERKAHKVAAKKAKRDTKKPKIAHTPRHAPVPLVSHAAVAQSVAAQIVEKQPVQAPVHAKQPPAKTKHKAASMDMVVRRDAVRPQNVAVPQRPVTTLKHAIPSRQLAPRPISPLQSMGMRSMDGVIRTQRIA